MVLSFLLLAIAVVLLGLVEVTSLGTGAVWVAVVLAVASVVVAAAGKDRRVG